MLTELALRPMSTSRVLDRTFSLYKSNFFLFAGITALPPGLFLIGRLLLLFATTYLSARGDPTTTFVGAAVADVGFLVLLLLALVGYALASAATVYAVSRLHLGHTTTIAESYRLIWPYFGNILGIAIIVSICVFGAATLGVVCVVLLFTFAGQSPLVTQGFWFGLALFAAILAGTAALGFALFLAAKFSLTVPACVLERLGVTDSIRRSWDLTQGSVLRLILIIILTAVMGLLLRLVLYLPYVVGVAILFSGRTSSGRSALMPLVVWQYVADFLSSTLAGPVSTIAGALIYYDQRVRKEAFDLQLMMEAIGQPAQQAAAAAPGVG